MLNRIRELPVGQSPEDVMRNLAREGPAAIWDNHQSALNYINDLLEKNPDIEGLIGYSEGAMMGATFILDEARKLQETGRPRRIKCALFFTGWPPITPGGKIVLADETDVMVDVPTLHVVGANGEDPQLRSFRSSTY
jgi:hypothetical protein